MLLSIIEGIHVIISTSSRQIWITVTQAPIGETDRKHASWMRLDSTIAVRLTNPDRVTVEVMTTLSRRGPNLDVTVKEKPVLVG